MEDDEIIQLFYARSEQAIAELAKKYGDILSFMSYNILKNKMDVEELYEEKELAVLISLFLDRLDRKSRLLFVRRYYFSDSTAKLADMFSISENNVSVKLHRIRDKLKKYLKKEGYGI